LLGGRKAILTSLLCSVGLHAVVVLRFIGAEQSSAPVASPGHSIRVELQRYTAEQPAVESRAKLPPPTPVRQAPATTQVDEPALVASNRPAPLATAAAVTRTPSDKNSRDDAAPQQSRLPPRPSPASQTRSGAAQSALLLSAKQQYLQQIAAHLDAHKFYPGTARRRHIEGAVQVSFELLEDGNISNLHILSGHSTLQKATEESIYHALPLPARPQQLLSLHRIKIEYAMRFSLRD